jgi:glutathione reductase (NADPH)
LSEPSGDFDVDLFVIGAGSGGTRAARIAAQHGARVMVAEEFRVGGTCVIRGCVPKKLMVYASRFADAFEEAEGFGWHLEKPSFDWRKLVAAKEKEITRLSGLYVQNIEKAGASIYDGRARVAGAQAIALADGRTIRAKTILVATGAHPRVLDHVPGHELMISSNEIFDLPVFPKRLLVIGAGYIGVEFASVFTRLGSRVTVVVRSRNILRGFDDDMRDGLREAMTRAGVRFEFDNTVAKVERGPDGLAATLADGRVIGCDVILNASGRVPNTEGLGLAEAGVRLGDNGEVCVDDASQSSVPSIYAVGDVTDRVALTPVAIREGHAFADTVFGGRDVRVDHATIATAVFTTPEIGTVGLTEQEAIRQYPLVDVYAASFRPMKATLSGREERTIMKIVVDGKSDRVLGVHILGEDAGELAQVLGIAVKMGATKADFDATVAVHPTAAEELVTMRMRQRRHEKPLEEAHSPGLADC